MPQSSYIQALPLGSLNGRPIQVAPALLQRSQEHARALLAGLGSHDVESSLAAYWALETRLRQWQRLAQQVGLERLRQAQLLEVGSGLGLFTLTGRMLGFRVVGLESSSERYQASLHIARGLFADHNCEQVLVQALSEALPLPAASVDVVTSFQTFEHVADLQQSLAEIRRVLRPGGILFAQAPNYHSFFEPHYGLFVPLAAGKRLARAYLRVRGRPTGFLDHLQWLSPAMLRRALAEAGFARVEVSAISTSSVSADLLPAHCAALPFRFKRGRLTRRLAKALALLAALPPLRAEIYPQLEVWAEA